MNININSVFTHNHKQRNILNTFLFGDGPRTGTRFDTPLRCSGMSKSGNGEETSFGGFVIILMHQSFTYNYFRQWDMNRKRTIIA